MTLLKSQGSIHPGNNFNIETGEVSFSHSLMCSMSLSFRYLPICLAFISSWIYLLWALVGELGFYVS